MLYKLRELLTGWRNLNKGFKFKMDILIVAVNYNSYTELYNYLSSINAACKKCIKKSNITVVIADNSLEKEYIKQEYDNIDIIYNSYNNLGYLGGASAIINNIDVSKYDYIIISNVDIIIDDNFFNDLSDYPITNDVAWIANKIWSNEENRDRNPKILERYSKKQLNTILMLYKYPILDWIYKITLYRRKSSKLKFYKEREIYAGHGSFIILTKKFFSRYEKIVYPIFLFGEEIYLAELIKKAGMRVCYCPKIKVYDNEHISTREMKKNIYYKCNKEAIEYIIKEFYE